MKEEGLSLTEAEVKELTKLIKEQGKLPVTKGVVDFCKIWPTVKGGLELLKEILGQIPGISFFAKAAIGIVISAGDAAVGALCSK